MNVAFSHRVSQGGSHDPDRMERPLTFEEMLEKYLDLLARTHLVRERLGKGWPDIARGQLGVLEEVVEDLAAILSLASCGQCPRSRKERPNSPCLHVVERRNRLREQGLSLAAALARRVWSDPKVAHPSWQMDLWEGPWFQCPSCGSRRELPRYRLGRSDVCEFCWSAA